MAENYLAYIAGLLGIPIWLFIIILIWSAAWKLVALWKSARNDSIVWFIVLAITNTVGILPILYIFIFSNMGKKAKKKVKKRRKKK